MYVINAENVNDALAQGISLIRAEGVAIDSRNGMTLEVPGPVATVYSNPAQRVLISRARDANPFFHLMESLWIIAGRSDVKFLNEFNKRMVEFSDNGISFNAPYGYRLRKGFYDKDDSQIDQIKHVINLLRSDPGSRQAVCQIWDTNDIDKDTKDKACNMSIVFRVRAGKLDMIVYNRSNDMVWGAYGANAVHFSMLQEYVAATIGIPMGTYTQVSNSFHVYTGGAGGAVFRRVLEGFDTTVNPYDCFSQTVNMCPTNMVAFEHDLKQFFTLYDNHDLFEVSETTYWKSYYFKELILPMLSTYLVHKKSGFLHAHECLKYIVADDWRMAARDWLFTRVSNRGSK